MAEDAVEKATKALLDLAAPDPYKAGLVRPLIDALIAAVRAEHDAESERLRVRLQEVEPVVPLRYR